MSSAAKKKANRRNGARSRGPKSAEGKARSSQNRFLYAIDARAFVAAGEDASRFKDLARMVLDAFRPRTRFERLLVHRLCSQMWQRDRLLRMERAMLGDLPAVATLPEGLRQSATAGPCLDRLNGLLELQIKLDDAIQQSICLLLHLGLGEQQHQSTEAPTAATGATPAKIGPVFELSPNLDLQRYQLADAPAVGDVQVGPEHGFSMAAPRPHFGDRGRKPRGR